MEGLQPMVTNDRLTVAAPAKINLTLEVLAKRADGFHEIRSVIQTVNIYDRLTLQSSPDTVIEADIPEWNAGKSLVLKAVQLLRQLSGGDKGVRINVEKVIPLVSGLGGDSSDAAAVLRGLNRLWGLGLSMAELHGLAGQLGSEPFCSTSG